MLYVNIRHLRYSISFQARQKGRVIYLGVERRGRAVEAGGGGGWIGKPGRASTLTAPLR